jgi:hypothetical protein
MVTLKQRCEGNEVQDLQLSGQSVQKIASALLLDLLAKIKCKCRGPGQDYLWKT